VGFSLMTSFIINTHMSQKIMINYMQLPEITSRVGVRKKNYSVFFLLLVFGPEPSISIPLTKNGIDEKRKTEK
jgi:hypothetical protein